MIWIISIWLLNKIHIDHSHIFVKKVHRPLTQWSGSKGGGNWANYHKIDLYCTLINIACQSFLICCPIFVCVCVWVSFVFFFLISWIFECEASQGNILLIRPLITMSIEHFALVKWRRETEDRIKEGEQTTQYHPWNESIQIEYDNNRENRPEESHNGKRAKSQIA